MQEAGFRALMLNRSLWLIVLAAMAGLYAIFAIDVFQEETATLADRKMRIELDELLLYASALMLALFGFGISQHRARAREQDRRIEAERSARDLGYYDALTGLPNRRAFDEALAGLAEAAPGALHAVLMLDLDGFKAVNDLHGHGTGDALLRAVAARIAGAVREGDCAARLGGDEFAVIAPALADPQAAVAIAGRIAACITLPVTIDGASHRVGTGIGIALARSGTLHPTELLRRADVALYAAKRGGGEPWRVYGAGLEA